MERKQSVMPIVLAAILLLVASVYFYHGNIKEFPAYIHAWTQSDRYAISLGFLHNHLNFSHPQTFCLNPDYSITANGTPTPITSVDFPIHEYIVALVMKVTGHTTPMIFRSYMLLYSLTGLVFLFLFVRKFTGSILPAIAVALFTFTCPAFCYYQDGFIPSITSLANLFIAIYFYYTYITSGNKKHFTISVIFFTLSALCRIPFTVFLVAATCTEFIRSRKNNLGGKNVVMFFSGIAAVGLYYLYNMHLQHEYGSIFLGEFRYPESWDECVDILTKVYNNWAFQYFTGYHYLFMGMLGIMFIIIFFKSKVKLKTILSNPLVVFLILSTLGATLYAALMLRQFVDHDYYFLDSFFPIIILTLCLLSGSLVRVNKLPALAASAIAIIVFCMGFVRSDIQVQQERRETGDWDRVSITTRNFQHSNEFLDWLKIPSTARILVIDSYTTNIPFILMQREGFCVMNTTEDDIKDALGLPYDYVVIQDQFLNSDVVNNFPPIVNWLDRVSGNGKISVYKKRTAAINGSVERMLGFDERKPFFHYFLNFDTIVTDTLGMTNYKHLSHRLSHSGHYSASLDYGTGYGLSITKNYQNNNPGYVEVSGYFYRESKMGECDMVATISNPDTTEVFLQKTDIKDLLDETDHWKYLKFIFVLPPAANPKDKLNIYIWNKSQSTLYYDDMSIAAY